MDGGDIYVIEIMQGIAERCCGAKIDLPAGELLRGERFWKALGAGSWEARGSAPELLKTALCRSNRLNWHVSLTAMFCHNRRLETICIGVVRVLL